tara:strand:- start:113 stop:421 length:309 start_codon:yes stop_codon:yes gene_type:complete
MKMIKNIHNDIELNNNKQGKRYAYYALRDGDSHKIVMCIEDVDGFRPIESDSVKNLTESEAKTIAEAMNFNIGMKDENTIDFIVLSTMRGRRKNPYEIDGRN